MDDLEYQEIHLPTREAAQALWDALTAANDMVTGDFEDENGGAELVDADE